MVCCLPTVKPRGWGRMLLFFFVFFFESSLVLVGCFFFLMGELAFEKASKRAN